MKRLIIEVSQDELRLPLVVCDSYKEMAQATGVNVRRIRYSCDNAKKGALTRFERVFVEED